MSTESFWTIRLADLISFAILIATIAAIYFGPIRAVEVSRKRDREREAEWRKRQILTSLMRTRKTTMNPDHVGALNQVQLEFSESPAVISAYRNYIAHLSDQVPSPGNALDNFMARRNELFLELLHQMGRVIGIDNDRFDLERLAYVPLGWATEEDEIRVFRRSLIDVLQGRQPIHVAPFQPAATPQTAAPYNPFPPPPP